jgi:hypothetical protein
MVRARDMAAAALLAVLASGPALAQSAPHLDGLTPVSMSPPVQQQPVAPPPTAPTLPTVLPSALPTTGPQQPASPVGPSTTWPWLQNPGSVPAVPSGLAGLPAGPHGHCAQCNPHEDNNGALLCGDPLLDDPPWAPPGWFTAVEVDFVATHLENRLGSTISNGTFIHLPTADLAWTVAPRIEIGYRFCEGAGELLLAYKFLVTAGSQPVPGFDAAGGTGDLHSHLSENTWDLDYGSREYSLLPNWDMKWRAGVRLATVFFDSTATSPLLEQREVNNFVGAGPHIGLDLRRVIRCTGLELFSRIDNAWMIGETDQSYEEIPVGGTGGASRFLSALVVPWLNVQAGVGWTPPGNEHLYFMAGYTWERWWGLADVGGSRGPFAIITSQGAFARLEVRY